MPPEITWASTQAVSFNIKLFGTFKYCGISYQINERSPRVAPALSQPGLSCSVTCAAFRSIQTTMLFGGCSARAVGLETCNRTKGRCGPSIFGFALYSTGASASSSEFRGPGLPMVRAFGVRLPLQLKRASVTAMLGQAVIQTTSTHRVMWRKPSSEPSHSSGGHLSHTGVTSHKVSTPLSYSPGLPFVSLL